jgi:glycosyltransferase involved in cell wall biosynthesis
MDLIVEAFNRRPDLKLVVIGGGPMLQRLKQQAKSNVQILGYQPIETLVEYMQRARAFVFAAEEDFGITPVEAQSCGTPVIAFEGGGARETVRGLESENATGVFFSEQSPESLLEAIETFEKTELRIKPEACAKNAERFSEDRFREELSTFVRSTVRDWKDGALIATSGANAQATSALSSRRRCASAPPRPS